MRTQGEIQADIREVELDLRNLEDVCPHTDADRNALLQRYAYLASRRRQLGQESLLASVYH